MSATQSAPNPTEGVQPEAPIITDAPSATVTAPTDQKAASQGLDKSSPLGQLASKLGGLLETSGHHEMYGVELSAWNEGYLLVSHIVLPSTLADQHTGPTFLCRNKLSSRSS